MTDGQSTQARRRHHDIQRALADRPRNAPREQRRRLYGERPVDSEPQHAQPVYAVEVSVSRVLSDGMSVPVPPASAQLRSPAAALAPGGVYVCITPNALSGPHYFGDAPTGFHLRGYTNRELRARLHRAFARGRGFVLIGRRALVYPLVVPIALQVVLGLLGAPGRRVARRAVLRKALGNRIVATRR